jgi:hypothetical protein
MAKLTKAPKRPKASASIATWERFEARKKDHAKKVAEIQNAAKKKIAIMKRTASK